jgi:hypothetical protein
VGQQADVSHVGPFEILAFHIHLLRSVPRTQRYGKTSKTSPIH